MFATNPYLACGLLIYQKLYMLQQNRDHNINHKYGIFGGKEHNAVLQLLPQGSEFIEHNYLFSGL